MTELYHRYDGYEELKPLLDGTDEDLLLNLGGKPALVRIPAAATTAHPRARLLACLMHGNEPSGYRAVLDVLRRGERFAFDLWVLIGNVRAATQEGWYANRYLDDQEDFNRVWDRGPATTRMRRCAATILEELRAADLEAAIDLHNNSGQNPYYAIVPRSTPAAFRLAALCADTVLEWKLDAHTLMEALSDRCPSVAVECGQGHLADGAVFAGSVVHRFLNEEGFAVPSAQAGPGPRHILETRERVTVRDEVTFAFGGTLGDETDLVVAAGLDMFNFGTLVPGHVIGQVDPGAAMPLCATDMAGRDVTARLFDVTPDGILVVAEEMTPIMMTTTVVQARRDCLFYTAGRIA